MSCPYCKEANPLDDTAEKWLFDAKIDCTIANLAFGAVLHPQNAKLSISVVTDPILKEIFYKDYDINYCPMCGRALRNP